MRFWRSTGEENTAASAIRTLLQQHHVSYKVVERDSVTKQHGVRVIVRDGPSVLITTSTIPLRGQMGTRVFTLEIPEDIQRVRQALAMQAEIELHGTPPPDAALVAYQAYLQALAPWEVVVPFAVV